MDRLIEAIEAKQNRALWDLTRPKRSCQRKSWPALPRKSANRLKSGRKRRPCSFRGFLRIQSRHY